jgi:hypothetical protein
MVEPLITLIHQYPLLQQLHEERRNLELILQLNDQHHFLLDYTVEKFAKIVNIHFTLFKNTVPSNKLGIRGCDL